MYLIVSISERVVKSLDFLGKLLILSVNINIAGLLFLKATQFLLKFRNMELELLTVLNQIIELLLQGFLILLYISILIELGLDLSIPILPLLDLAKSALQNTSNAIILELDACHFSFITLNLVL